MKFRLSESGYPADLDTLVDTRLLVQANSGGGKSWCIRRLLEQTHGHVQHLVIDPEGEFSSLREKYDYVLAARHAGDTGVDPRAARLLAERLLELGVSAILDIYELKAHERVRFVRQFLEALVDAPKKLWHPALVVVDEAHVFCPQAGEAESAGAVIDLATRGRKRGFCAVLATQRLSKLHKDAAAECNNKLIGRTGLDVDVKRAADELGLLKERWRELRDLAPGEFFAFGPALSREVQKVKVGPVETRHPKAGARLAAVPVAPTAKIRALLPKLADLPAEVEARQKTEAELRREVSTLKLELRKAGEREAAPLVKIERVEVPVFTEAMMRANAALVERVEKIGQQQIAALTEVRNALERVPRLAGDHYVATIQKQHASGPPARVPGSAGVTRTTKTPATSSFATSSEGAKQQRPAGNGVDLQPARQRILDALAFLEGIGIASADKTQVALMADARPTSGAYFNNLGALRTSGLIRYPTPGFVALTDAGRSKADPVDVPDTPKKLHERLRSKLPPAKWKILEALIGAYPEHVGKGELAELAGARATSGAYFNNLGSLRSLGLIDYPEPGLVIARRVLFLEGA